MKKILLALLALILAFSLVACNTGNSSGKETTDTDAETTTKADVTDDRNHDSDDDDDSTGTTTNTVKPGTATKPNDTAGTEDSTNNNNKPADTTNNGGSTVTTQNSGNTNTPAEPSVFDKLYNSNKNNKLSFVDAMSLFEDLIASPVALEDSSESFRISFTAMMDYSLTEGNDTEESQLPVTVDYIHVKNGDYSLSFSIMDSLLATTSRVDGVIYTSITDLESGEASKIKVQPTEQELEEFLNEYNALISSLDFEALMNEIMGYSGPQVSNKVTPTGAYEVVTDITGGSVIITKPGAGDVEISTFDNQLDFVPDGKDPD